MADISKEILKKEVHEILKDADLNTTSSKKVRLQLQEKLGCNLLSRKSEIDSIVMDFVNAQQDDDEDEDEESDEEEEVAPVKKPQAKKRGAPAKRSSAGNKRAKDSSDEDESSGKGESCSDSDEPKPKKKAPAKKKRGKKGSDSDDGSDEEWEKPKEEKKSKAKSSGTGKSKGTGFTRAYTLSPDLAALMGADSLPRHEVVKKVWAMIKEKNLYDPKNKQFAICDEALHKVMGVKRFRTFGMLKYLKSHFID